MRPIASHAREAAWSPNGREIVYWVEDYTASRLRIVTPSGRLVREIRFPRELYLRAPFWSPDGKRIAFTANGLQGPVYSVRRDGSGLHVIARGPLSFGVWGRAIGAVSSIGAGASEPTSTRLGFLTRAPSG
jgi:Tol biopolymer transport system component